MIKEIKNLIPELDINTTTSINIDVCEEDIKIKEYLKDKGRDWQCGRTRDDIYGLCRFATNENEIIKGNFFTNIYSMPNAIAIKYLELPLSNTAKVKRKAKVLSNSMVWFGKHSKNDNSQIYVPDSGKIEYIENVVTQP